MTSKALDGDLPAFIRVFQCRFWIYERNEKTDGYILSDRYAKVHNINKFDIMISAIKGDKACVLKACISKKPVR